MASDAGRLLFITIIIMMIKACYYQQAFILSRAALQLCAIVSSEYNNRADSRLAASSYDDELMASSMYAILSIVL